MKKEVQIVAKYYDILPNPVALFDISKKQAVCIYKNSKYQALSIEKKFWVRSKLKKVIEAKDSKINEGISFFNINESTVGCIIDKDLISQSKSISKYVPTISEYVMTVTLNLSKNKVLSDMPFFEGSLLTKIDSNKGDSINSFFKHFNDYYLKESNFLTIFSRENILKCFEMGSAQLDYEVSTVDKRFFNIAVFSTVNKKTDDVLANFVVNDLTAYMDKLADSEREKYQLLYSVGCTYDYIGYLDLERGRFKYLLSEKMYQQDMYKSFQQRNIEFAKKYIYYKDIEKYISNMDIDVIQNKIREKTSYSFNVRQSTEDGYHVKEYTIMRSKDFSNEREIAIICCRDINQLAESQSVINSLSFSYDLACCVDLIHNRFYTLHSSGADAEYGNYTEYIESSVLKNVHPEDIELVKEFFKIENISMKLNKEETITTRCKMLTNGEYRYVQVFCTANNRINNQVVSVVLLTTDIHEAVIQEENAKIILSEAMESASISSKAKTRFLSRMSHDLRTPLYSIIGMTGLAISSIDDKKKIKSNLETIADSSRHLLGLINEMLDIARIENGRLSLNEESINLDEFLAEIISMTKPLADEHKIKLDTSFINLKNKHLILDKQRLKQLLVNLISNAIKYNTAEGKVSFKVIGEDNASTTLCKYMFIVEDNGIGMKQEFLDKIFQPYSRADESKEGTGIGLTISKSIVDLLNGEIQVDSKYGQGTKFCVTFQFKKDEKATEKKYSDLLPKAKEVLAGKNILLVEDNIINVEIAKQIIESTKANVTVAGNGKEAVEVFAKSKDGFFDLVFMDVQMPYLNGYQATKQIRDLERLDVGKVPIIGMSANAFTDDIIKGKENGMIDYLSKPVEANEIIKIMVKYLN